MKTLQEVLDKEKLNSVPHDVVDFIKGDWCFIKKEFPCKQEADIWARNNLEGLYIWKTVRSNSV